MPTHILRDRTRPPQPPKGHGAPRLQAVRTACFTIGTVHLRVELAASQTAERLWAMLPLYSKAEPWGSVIHFEIPVEIGRDRSARLNARAGEIYLWAEEDRILLPYGPSPISRDTEIRLPRPCNVLGVSLDDLGALEKVRPGDKVSITRNTS